MTTTELTRQRREAIAAFYAAHHRHLTLRVHRWVRGISDATVDDACAFAWLQLVRRGDIRLDRGGLGWLTLVAAHEALRLHNSHERPAGSFIGHPDERDELPEPPGPTGDPLDRVIASETHCGRIARFAHLKPRERRDLAPVRRRLPLPGDRRVIWSHRVSSPRAKRCRALTTCR
jgi:DNA-directed RNA polymerase specialized sigma24 family protein